MKASWGSLHTSWFPRVTWGKQSSSLQSLVGFTALIYISSLYCEGGTARIEMIKGMTFNLEKYSDKLSNLFQFLLCSFIFFLFCLYIYFHHSFCTFPTHLPCAWWNYLQCAKKSDKIKWMHLFISIICIFFLFSFWLHWLEVPEPGTESELQLQLKQG